MIKVEVKEKNNLKPFPKLMEIIDKSKGNLIVYFYNEIVGLPIFATGKAYDDFFGKRYEPNTNVGENFVIDKFIDFDKEITLKNE